MKAPGIYKILNFLILLSNLNAQVKIADSNGLNFRSLVASFYEPKMGVMKYFDKNSLKVDIGNSVDLIEVEHDKNRITVGVDFFAYVLVNNHGFLILRVEALDGFFGGNMSFKNDNLSVRLRILHRSAHLVDEYGEINKKPFPFTREFSDLIFAFNNGKYRLYCGASYVFRTKPSDVERFYLQSGFEFFKKVFQDINFIQSPLTLIFAVDIKFWDKIYGSNLTSGFKLGNWNSKGIFLYFVYYYGFDIYGQYFNLNRKFGGVGCYFEF